MQYSYIAYYYFSEKEILLALNGTAFQISETGAANLPLKEV